MSANAYTKDIVQPNEFDERNIMDISISIINYMSRKLNFSES